MKPTHTTQERIESALASSEHPGWFSAGARLLLVLAFVPVLMMIPPAFGEDVDSLLALADRCSVYGWMALGLASLSGLFHALHKLTRWKHSTPKELPK